MADEGNPGIPRHLLRLAELILQAVKGEGNASGLVKDCFIDVSGIPDFACYDVGRTDSGLDEVTKFVVQDVEMRVRGNTVFIQPRTRQEDPRMPVGWGKGGK